MNVIATKQAQDDKINLIVTSICGNNWMIQQIKQGKPDKRVSIERGLSYLHYINETAKSIKQSSYITSHYYGYKFYKTLNATLAFYIVPVRNTPYSMMLAVNPKIDTVIIMRLLVHSVENALRLLKSKGVTIDRYNTDNYKVCSLNRRTFNLALLESLIAGRY